MRDDTEEVCDQVMADMTLVEKVPSAHDSEKHMPSAVARSRTSADGSTRTNIITWDSEDDPSNPRKFSNGKKLRLLLILSMITFIV